MRIKLIQLKSTSTLFALLYLTLIHFVDAGFVLIGNYEVGLVVVNGSGYPAV